MELSTRTTCPNCHHNQFTAKHRATYVYNYTISLDNNTTEEFIPFLFDRRDHLESQQFLECNQCKSKFPCEFGPLNKGINMTILQKAIRSEHTSVPDYFG